MTDATWRAAGEGLALLLDGGPVAELALGSVELARRHVGAVVGAVPTVGSALDGSPPVVVRGPVAPGLDGTWTVRPIGGQPVFEVGLELHAVGERPVAITRMDPLALRLDRGLGHWTAHWYRSAWGDECRPRRGTTRHDVVLDVRSGRSSHGTMPWLGLVAEQHPLALLVLPAWSGNWRIEALAAGVVSAGISPWQLAVELRPGESVQAPPVVIALGTGMDDAALALQRAVRDDWLLRSPTSDAVPVEWNHWWPYEDQEVTEQVVRANAEVAAGLGVEVATVDAGWFGDADATSDWQEQRGDWARVNTQRFPSGLQALGDAVRATGLQPGIWVEAEAVGSSSLLRRERPELLALAVDGRRHDPSYRVQTASLDPDDPSFLGYVCLGSAAGRDHVLKTLCDVVEAMGARWLKLDFNVDPDAGCTRTDHGHGAGDGLLRHYLGLYEVLDAFRDRHPEVLLEACSSGGLRIDLGLARHVHGFFLSDPDYTEHHLEVVMGVTRMLPPLGVLHWSQSQWRNPHPEQQLDWAALDGDRFDTMLRAASAHRFGVSLRLDELRDELRERLAAHVALYRSEVVPLVRNGVLRPLTAPPERGGLGERTPAVQLSDEARDAHVVLVVALDGPPDHPPSVRPAGLSDRRRYDVRDLATGSSQVRTGAQLRVDGLPLAHGTASSWWVRIDPAGEA